MEDIQTHFRSTLSLIGACWSVCSDSLALSQLHQLREDIQLYRYLQTVHGSRLDDAEQLGNALLSLNHSLTRYPRCSPTARLGMVSDAFAEVDLQTRACLQASMTTFAPTTPFQSAAFNEIMHTVSPTPASPISTANGRTRSLAEATLTAGGAPKYDLRQTVEKCRAIAAELPSCLPLSNSPSSADGCMSICLSLWSSLPESSEQLSKHLRHILKLIAFPYARYALFGTVNIAKTTFINGLVGEYFLPSKSSLLLLFSSNIYLKKERCFHVMSSELLAR